MRSRALLALASALLAVGCQSTQQILDDSQQQAIATAVRRGQFELNCPQAQASVISRELTQPMIQGPLVGGLPRPEYTVGVEGCGQREVYLVICPPGGGGCFAAGSRDGFRG
jgi:hypothetical protein